MATSYRPVRASDGTIIQDGLTVGEDDYADMRFTKLVLGVVLDVYPSDKIKNRSAQQTTNRHGHTHECTVLVVNDGSSAYMTLENVIITPDAPSGLDDYSERLPRPSSVQVDGEALDSSLQGIDPYNLDGDWCVVAFMGGRIEAPFILRWWPHARNVFDTATSGEGYDSQALVQNRRYFRRINGVETVITSKGHIIVSTNLTNSILAPGSDPKTGRFPRSNRDEEGGSIKLAIKPSQLLEITFNKHVDGQGIFDSEEPELPQVNPPQSTSFEYTENSQTYIFCDKEQINISLPDTFNLKAGNSAIIKAENLVELEAEQIKLGKGAGSNPVILGEEMRLWLRDKCRILSPFGPLKIDPLTLTADYDLTQSNKSVVE